MDLISALERLNGIQEVASSILVGSTISEVPFTTVCYNNPTRSWTSL